MKDYAKNLVCFEPLGLERSWELEQYRKIGGYEAWERILRDKPAPPRPRNPEAFTSSMIFSGAGFSRRMRSHAW